MTAATRPRTRTGLTVVELDGEAIVYDGETSRLHRLNATGRIIFSLCDGSATVAELAADLAELYGLPCQDVETHVDSMLAGLESAGLLVENGRGAGAATASRSERPAPPSVDPPGPHLHTKRRGNP